MTDGPHKSLPQKRPWKVLAESAANQNFLDSQVCEAMNRAVRSELAAIPFDRIHNAFLDDQVAHLFSSNIDQQIERLEASRELCRGSAVGSTYLDCMVISAINGDSLSDAINSAMKGCIQATLHSSKLSTIEHYKRKGAAADAAVLSQRWDQACRKCDFGVHAKEAAENGKVRAGRRAATKLSGLLDGPPMKVKR